MAKRVKAPSNLDITSAIGKAQSGNGRPLAALVKSFSEKDLARGFARASVYGFGHYDPWWSLQIALVFAAGMKSAREELNVRLREVDKRVRREPKGEAAEVSHG